MRVYILVLSRRAGSPPERRDREGPGEDCQEGGRESGRPRPLRPSPLRGFGGVCFGVSASTSREGGEDVAGEASGEAYRGTPAEVRVG